MPVSSLLLPKTESKISARQQIAGQHELYSLRLLGLHCFRAPIVSGALPKLAHKTSGLSQFRPPPLSAGPEQTEQSRNQERRQCTRKQIENSHGRVIKALPGQDKKLEQNDWP